LVRTDKEAALAVSQTVRESVAAILQKEQEREIGDAGLEVLGILLYEGPSTRAQIDYVRGVNSSSTIRTLLTRGLIERSGNPEDGREYLYRPTVELLAHLGVTETKYLPDYETIARELTSFKSTQSVFDAPEQGRTY
jgi:segregation and condensation protein B